MDKTMKIRGYLAKDYDGTTYVYLKRPVKDKNGIYRCNKGKTGVLLFAQQLIPPSPIGNHPVQCEVTVRIRPTASTIDINQQKSEEV